jgi:hypothetical protein
MQFSRSYVTLPEAAEKSGATVFTLGRVAIVR